MKHNPEPPPVRNNTVTS